MRFKDDYRLRRPTGPYIPGFLYLVYEYRPNGSDAVRTVPCQCYYPTAGAGQIKKYVSEHIFPDAGGIKTNTLVGPPVAEGKHPILVFSHGNTLCCEANTIQCEALASHGYIILNVGHQGDGRYVLPDGRVLTVADQTAGMSEDQIAAVQGVYRDYADWLADRAHTATWEQHRDRFAAYAGALPDDMPRRTERWVTDNLFALEAFLSDAASVSSPFFDKTDRARIGAFGMSLGGAAAIGMSCRSKAILACANLDGAVTNPAPIPKPVLLMQSSTPAPSHYLRFPYLNAASDAYLATVAGSTHSNFTDMTEILADDAAPGGGKLLGSIDPDHMERMLNALLVDFFDKYLRGRPSQVLDNGTAPDGVTICSAIK